MRLLGGRNLALVTKADALRRSVQMLLTAAPPADLKQKASPLIFAVICLAPAGQDVEHRTHDLSEGFFLLHSLRRQG